MKKILFILSILFIIPVVFSSSYLDYITYSKLNGEQVFNEANWFIDTLTVDNFTATDTSLENATVINYNITNNLDVYGNATFHQNIYLRDGEVNTTADIIKLFNNGTWAYNSTFDNYYTKAEVYLNHSQEGYIKNDTDIKPTGIYMDDGSIFQYGSMKNPLNFAKITINATDPFTPTSHAIIKFQDSLGGAMVINTDSYDPLMAPASLSFYTPFVGSAGTADFQLGSSNGAFDISNGDLVWDYSGRFRLGKNTAWIEFSGATDGIAKIGSDEENITIDFSSVDNTAIFSSNSGVDEYRFNTSVNITDDLTVQGTVGNDTHRYSWGELNTSTGDNLGNHIATKDLNMSNKEIKNVSYISMPSNDNTKASLKLYGTGKIQSVFNGSSGSSGVISVTSSDLITIVGSPMSFIERPKAGSSGTALVYENILDGTKLANNDNVDLISMRNTLKSRSYMLNDNENDDITRVKNVFTPGASLIYEGTATHIDIDTDFGVIGSFVPFPPPGAYSALYGNFIGRGYDLNFGGVKADSGTATVRHQGIRITGVKNNGYENLVNWTVGETYSFKTDSGDIILQEDYDTANNQYGRLIIGDDYDTFFFYNGTAQIYNSSFHKFIGNVSIGTLFLDNSTLFLGNVPIKSNDVDTLILPNITVNLINGINISKMRSKKADNNYLYNDTDTMYFNSSKLNNFLNYTKTVSNDNKTVTLRFSI